MTNIGDPTCASLTLCLGAARRSAWPCGPQPAAAYIGPGAGITMLGALWGVIVAVALAIGAVLFWPIRLLLRKLRKPRPRRSRTVAPRQGVLSRRDAVSSVLTWRRLSGGWASTHVAG